MTKKWEYKIVQPDTQGMGLGLSGKKIRASSEAFLNRLGQEGWECYHVKTDDFPSVFYLKRQR